MTSGSVCPGCGLALPQPNAVVEQPEGSSIGCWSVYLEVSAFETEHPFLLAGHQLLVDAYGAQHATPGTIRLPYSLVGLHLALDRGWTGPAVRGLHGRMGKPQPDWPTLLCPAAPTALTWTGTAGRLTILDVAERGARPGSLDGHEAALRAWAADVWAAWSPQHDAVASLAGRFT